MKLACQIAYLALAVSSLFTNIYWNVNGRKASEPTGFSGIVTTFIVYGATVALYWGAGMYEGFFR
jgi:hypothetical protein